ncbi:MAG TPA: IclR family transcriptional regulator C-terminal domain-containing protein [Actinophytocola sp.]|uniref:IclR family transcriptional regulator domain-containing protein n=1 Tax=Actinophytocola sp. TaxID=1872138 RepID=UPI002DB5D4C3|nr:IclR family transcriptional regulator C-terminal domain-containing protein [Actinophytocola sp.]HEU5470569.1 IclR family transcriptional regulator C-terminal domain-containing protein [Actinophytocola sp.]
MKPAEDKDYVQSLERGLTVILAFSDKRPRLTLGQLASLTGLTRPTVRRLVLTLARLGYIRAEDRAFSLTPHVLALGYAFTSSLNLAELAQPHMEDVTEVTRHTCSLAALDGEDAVFLLRVPSRRAMAHLLLTSTRLPAFASAIGRVLLAGLPDPEVDSFLRNARFPRLTAHTETDPVRLRQIITEVRERGWEVVDQELEEGVRSFSAPVRASGGRVVAALGMSVAAGSVGLPEIHSAYLPAIVKAAGAISSRLGASYHPNGQRENTANA